MTYLWESMPYLITEELIEKLRTKHTMVIPSDGPFNALYPPTSSRKDNSMPASLEHRSRIEGIGVRAFNLIPGAVFIPIGEDSMQSQPNGTLWVAVGVSYDAKNEKVTVSALGNGVGQVVRDQLANTEAEFIFHYADVVILVGLDPAVIDGDEDAILSDIGVSV